MRADTLELINIYRKTPPGEYRISISAALDFLLNIEREEYRQKMSLVDVKLEEWRDIRGFKGLYKISNLGRLKSLSRKWAINEKILFGCIHKLGYVKVSLRKNNDYNIFFMHTIVAETFLTKVKGKKYINHINGDKTDNRVINLERCTNSENQLHSYLNGFSVSNPRMGEDCSYSKIDNATVIEIRDSINSGVSGNDLAIRYGISKGLVSMIKNRQRWKHI